MGQTPLQKREGTTLVLEFRDKILYIPAIFFKWRIVGTTILGVFVGMLNVPSEAVVVTEQSLAIKTRSANVRRIVE